MTRVDAFLARLGCWFRRQHDDVIDPVGGVLRLRCLSCGRSTEGWTVPDTVSKRIVRAA